MPHRLFDILFHLPVWATFEVKMLAASMIALTSFLADISSELKGVEELGVKAIFGGALIWCVRLLLAQQAEHKKEIRDIWAEHKRESLEREERSDERTDANTKALHELTAITKEQTDYFKTVTRNIVDEKINAKANPKLP